MHETQRWLAVAHTNTKRGRWIKRWPVSATGISFSREQWSLSAWRPLGSHRTSYLPHTWQGPVWKLRRDPITRVTLLSTAVATRWQASHKSHLAARERDIRLWQLEVGHIWAASIHDALLCECKTWTGTYRVQTLFMVQYVTIQLGVATLPSTGAMLLFHKIKHANKHIMNIFITIHFAHNKLKNRGESKTSCSAA